VRASSDYGQSAEPNWRDVPWLDHVHDVTVRGRSVHYVEMGEGKPVVLIHGLGSRWQIWIETIPTLAREYRVIALDLPGFGSSQMPEEEISISLFADTVDALCEELDTGPAAIVGHSMGGHTAAELALRHPQRVERLVLLGAAGVSTSDVLPQLGLAFLTGLQLVAPKHPTAQLRMLRRPKLRHALFASIVRHPLRIDPAVLYEQMRGFPKEALVPSFAAITGYDFRERLEEIEAPTLIMHGREDALVPLADATEYERHLHNSRTVIFDDTGHCPNIERPRRFNEELLRFLGTPVVATGPVSTSAAGGLR
jgi:pimeloyl-ACP methyl ester carboxylesterase